ncbi:DUF3696 domain-containing protein [Candidatus Poribacteria bacterium]|nr:DUF3696 domain-containing protein [Candidatus Poribacteria bacterium]MYG06271.1 DUF3696 domain-containing protein [Candidatus Poribacteria bacterium]MYK24243.1 DUF3696 domain-containing protein [Candidatus Poribacteria bacterium]
MITHIRMRNFKSWEDSKKVEIAPLTGFFGTNSSGKSSLLQMLLLLKQTVEHSDSEEVIFFGDENSLVSLGNFREVVHRHQVPSRLVFEFAGKLTHPRLIYNIPEDGSPWEQMIDQFIFDSVIWSEQQKSVVERLEYRSGREIVIYEKGSVFFPSPYEQGRDQRKIELSTCYGKILSGQTISRSTKLLSQFASAFEELFSHVYYLGPTRVHPQRLYHWEGDHPEDLGRWGSKAIDALLSARVDKRTIQHKEKEIPIEDRISEWLREMDLAYSFLLERDGKDYDVRIQKREYGPKVTLADMGYGLSQFLPVLVLCYYVPVGSTLILEQPGIHLHPKVQSQLADLLIEVVTERKLQVLVESHSEHLLTRLQLRIAEGKIPASDTALYFCENDNGVSTIKSLDVDELGNIKNWPKNFFGNVRGDLVKMTREQMKRQKKAEG